MTKVFIVDDHEIARTGLRTMLGDAVEVVGEADEPSIAAELILERAPDVVLVDVQMPGGGGAHTVSLVHARSHAVAFLAVSASARPEDVVGIIRAGALGYVTKGDADRDRLLAAIAAVADGSPYFSPELAGFVARAFDDVEPADVDPEIDRLTPREREVMIELAKGATNPEIAERLGISRKTVETHVGAVLRKLQLTTRQAVVRWVTERGL